MFTEYSVFERIGKFCATQNTMTRFNITPNVEISYGLRMFRTQCDLDTHIKEQKNDAKINDDSRRR